MREPVITLTTDFGLMDPYVAEMKGTILKICPNATIVDVTHQIEKFNIAMGSYVLAAASPYFPQGTIHLAVVDPDVGTTREPVIVHTKQGFLVGPDNGVLVLAARSQGMKHVYKISNPKLMLPRISNTFHGRDIFAPAAAHLANGIPPSKFGLKARKLTTPGFAKTAKRKDLLVGKIIYVDGFGNIVTDFSEKELKTMGIKRRVRIRIRRTRLKLKLCSSYAEVKPGQPLAIIGSHNFLEISVNQGNAAEDFKVGVGDKVMLYHS